MNETLEGAKSRREDFLKLAEDAIDMMELYKYSNSSEFERYDRKANNYIEMSSSILKYEIPIWESLVDSIKQVYTSGTVYASSFRTRDEYGNWHRGDTYKTYVRGKDGALEEYDGSESIPIIVSCFPDAAKNLSKNLMDVFSTLAQ